MAVRARQHIRRMRGGANAHLLLADDGQYYVVKFSNNPQHRRVLVNEAICCVLLDYLGLPAPGWQVVEVPQTLIDLDPALCITQGRETAPCAPGLHFGSRFPVDPTRQAVYDYVPVSMLRELLNRRTFLGMLAFDKWISNANGRQAVFYRTRAKDWLDAAGAEPEISPRSLVYVANFIDHGFAFNAQHWTFSDGPAQGLYPRREVYEEVRGLESFEPWLGRIENLPAEVLDDAYRLIPADWYGRDFDAVEGLLERLHARRGRTAELLDKVRSVSGNPFPNWDAGLAKGAGRSP